jgi:ABC-2 type transport system ATP-binding protein
MSTPVAEFVDVRKTYGSALRLGRTVEALRGVSFALEAGEVFAVLGPNRAGKTTLLKILLGLCRATAGRVFRFGRPIEGRETLARVGYMHENQAFPRYLTGEALLRFYGALAGLPSAFLRARVPELLQRVGLTERAREPIARYSKGMVQRLALAQALLGDPELLVLDEPMEGLDMNARRLLQETMRAQRAAGRSVLIVTHALGEVAPVCDRVAVLADGKLAYLGSLSALVGDPAAGHERPLESALAPFYGP